MRLTTKTRYGLRAMVDLANQPKGRPVPLIEVAERQGIKVKYLEQIFLRLHRAGLVKSKKGPGGGYFVARNPKLIKISEIMEAVGESRAPVLCVEEKRHKHCPRINQCPTRPYWKKLKKIIDTFLDSRTLNEVSKMR